MYDHWCCKLQHTTSKYTTCWILGQNGAGIDLKCHTHSRWIWLLSMKPQWSTQREDDSNLPCLLSLASTQRKDESKLLCLRSLASAQREGNSNLLCLRSLWHPHKGRVTLTYHAYGISDPHKGRVTLTHVMGSLVFVWNE